MQVVAIFAAALVGTAAAGGYAPVAPVAPVAKPCPTPLAQPVAPVAPAVVAPAATVTVIAPVVVKPKSKVHTCGGWNNKYNKKGCAAVNAVKCTLGSGKGSKYQRCSEEVCCGTPVTPVVPSTPSIITCAAYCSQNSIQCVVTTTGSCSVGAPYGQYNQCSKELCCAAPAPQPPAPQPQPQIVPCKAIVGGYGWNCYAAADYSCAVGAAYGPYPACSFGVCCLGSQPVNPCAGCNKPYGDCPAKCDPCKNCGDYCPSYCAKPDPCAGCASPYGYCPPQCQTEPECSAYNPCPPGGKCVNGKCQGIPAPCGGECKENQVCNVATNQCEDIPVVPCGGVCDPDTQVCNEVTNECEDIPEPPVVPCGGACDPDTQVCNETTDQCENIE